jgi:hypothetical protein
MPVFVAASTRFLPCFSSSCHAVQTNHISIILEHNRYTVLTVSQSKYAIRPLHSITRSERIILGRVDVRFFKGSRVIQVCFDDFGSFCSESYI